MAVLSAAGVFGCSTGVWLAVEGSFCAALGALGGSLGFLGSDTDGALGGSVGFLTSAAGAFLFCLWSGMKFLLCSENQKCVPTWDAMGQTAGGIIHSPPTPAAAHTGHTALPPGNNALS